ncbi:unnamed protein product [Phyllotreta striolata]|uniref:t-SNARE coiled-coil homology domain-containing protein n=1 Tax=Phyllotreta striolata TaxID=444603 RepID=A0A9N9TXY2_PHYSR|nr:unnamed protein product [Phyllotreta striolata]
MSSILNSHNKQPFKVIEVPLSKFKDEIIPHHQNVFESYKSNINMLMAISDEQQLRKEIKAKKRNVKQLRDLMYELDTLRTQVEDENLDQFDTKTLSLRKILLNLISGYSELEKMVNNTLTNEQSNDNMGKENQQPFEGTSHIQIHANIEDIKLNERLETLSKVENINRDVEDLHEMYKNLHEMVGTQAESVDHIENCVEDAHQNVEIGTRNLSKAHKLKAVAYPVTGAFLGGIIGGPIGLVAGLKVGGVAAVTCAIAGYTGGRWFKKKTIENSDEPEIPSVNDDADNKSDPVKKEI